MTHEGRLWASFEKLVCDVAPHVQNEVTVVFFYHWYLTRVDDGSLQKMCTIKIFIFFVEEAPHQVNY